MKDNLLFDQKIPPPLSIDFNDDRSIIIYEINKILISKINKKIKKNLINEKGYLIYKFHYTKNNKLSI